MKIIINVFFVFTFIFTANSSDRHVPWSHSHGTTGSAECWGYAQNRAYGRIYTDGTCPGNNISGDAMHLPYFYVVEYDDGGITNFGNAQVGDVIAWSNHAVYVSAKYGTSSTLVRVDHKPGPAEGEEKDVTLLAVIEGQMEGADPIYIYRKNNAWEYSVENSFGAGYIRVNGVNKASGSPIPNLYWESSQIIDAIEDGEYEHLGYIQLFDVWKKNGGTVSSTKEYNFTLDWDHNDDPTLRAEFVKQFDIEFYNNFTGVEHSGKLKVGSTTYDDIESENPFFVRETEQITFEAVNQTYNGITYTFDHWQDQSTSKARTVTPADHDTFTAYFNGEPVQITGFTWTCGLGDPISFTWNQHTNPNVLYRIYRKVKPQGGEESDPELIATKNNNQTSFTDNDYMRVSSYVYLLSYDVRSYYSVEQTEADGSWHSIYGMEFWKPQAERDQVNASEFSMTNFPNPFNPETHIVYALPEAAAVKIKIFNTSGQLVRVLSDGFQSAGVHVVHWDGTNGQNMHVSSGVYFLIAELPSAVHKRKLFLVK